MATKQATRTNQAITLKGSTALVTEFFEYGVNSMVKKYGLPMLVTSDDGLKEYIQTILGQVSDWLLSSSLTRLVLAIKSIETDETLERWQFDIHTEDGPTSAGAIPGAPKPTRKPNKTEKEVQGEIRDIMKQITSSVTFLPILGRRVHIHHPCIHQRFARRTHPGDLGRRRPTPHRPWPGRAGAPPQL
ncbi:hypothetical protein CcaverHIS002_0507180 [Cutaneotrichosporon cavernicola]|nr:hypothetical protein CcaverHIS002_0507180 [Cutaneotrichosporon cavernicola]